MPMINSLNVSENYAIFIFKGNEILTYRDSLDILPDKAIFNKCVENHLATDWFSEPEHNYITAQLEADSPTPTGCKWTPIRELLGINHPDSVLICRAIALLNWREKNRFCCKCGSHLHNSTDETAKKCLSCDSVFYPSLSPAIIVLVRKENKILLARHKNRNTDVFTCLAGYIEPGENIEECVKREVKEEAGIEITNIRYKYSQSWPFPDQLMIGFTADWESGELVPQKSEIDELKWFSKNDLPSIPKKGSVAYKLILSELETL